jgi:hypothetical protein
LNRTGASDFWTAVHDTLGGSGSAADNLARLEVQVTKLKGAGRYGSRAGKARG